MKPNSHLFVTDPGFNTSRWRVAFPDATVIESTATGRQGLASSGAPNGGWSVAWILTGIEDWEELVDRLAADGTRVIAMSRQPGIEELRVALGSGARGYVHAVSPPVVFRQAADAVLSGGMWLPSEVVNAVVRVLSSTGEIARSTPAEDGQVGRLTDREQAVAEAVASGLSNKEVARRLQITERTVKAHLSAVFRKWGVRDRMQLAVRLYRANGAERDRYRGANG
ncbi:MAG: response regulator transcription factor [Halothiobacillaceae bacterium]|nr:response regulator transcription factor [Halothiobacillaceae bacterium]HER34363.1 response regulator transcription factor [Halothiobacillaceae bacterium]